MHKIRIQIQSLLKLSFLLAFLISTFSGIAFSANQYIEIIVSRGNIRSAPTTSASLIATARRGDIFELLDSNQNWYQIQLFSGEVRHIHKSLAKQITYTPQGPKNTALRQQLFQAMIKAEERVVKEANERFPSSTRLRENLQYQTRLRDKYKLEVMHQLNTLAPVYRRIAIEGLLNKW